MTEAANEIGSAIAQDWYVSVAFLLMEDDDQYRATDGIEEHDPLKQQIHAVNRH